MRGTLALAAAAVVVAVVGLAWGPTLLELLSGGRPCSYLLRTGHPCAACGGTHALALAARGHIVRAWRRNPLGSYTGVALWGLGLAGALALIARRRTPLSFWGIGVLITGPVVFAWTLIVWLCRLP
jgi:hypothetical protein